MSGRSLIDPNSGPIVPDEEAEHNKPWAEIRQEERLKALPAFMQSSLHRLAYELAAELDPLSEIFNRYGYDEGAAVRLSETKEFQALYEVAYKEIREDGGSFRAKCRTMAEILLNHSFEMATDANAPAAVRANLIQWTAKMARLEPRPDKEDLKTAAGGMVVNITFAGGKSEVIGGTITREPVTIENGG